MIRRELFRPVPPRVLLTCVALVTTLLGACANSEPEAPAGAETPAPKASAATPQAGSGFAPVTSREAGSELSENTISAPGAVFTLPAGWRSEPPSSSMRLAQAAIPGDAGEAQMTVFHFGPGGGGGVEANLQRWIAQMEGAESAQAQREQITVGDFKITWVHVDGTLKAGTMGVGNANAQPNFTLLGAVVEGDQGPWFFKTLGPTGTLTGQKDNFLAMLQSVKRR